MRIVRTDPTDGSIYQLADGRWRAALQTAYVNGKRRRATKTSPLKREVVEWLREAKRAQAKGLDVSKDRLSLGAYVTRWLESPPPKLRESSVRAYAYAWRRMEAELGSIRLTRLSLVDVRKYIAKRIEAGAPTNTVVQERAFLHRIMEDATADAIVDRNVVDHAELPTKTRVERVVWTPEQAQHFLADTREHRLWALFNVAMSLGLRSGEVRGLRWEDVDLDSGTLNLRVQMVRTGYTVKDSGVAPDAPSPRRDLRAGTNGFDAATRAPRSDPADSRSRPCAASPGGAFHFAEPKSAHSIHALGMPPRLVAILTEHRKAQRLERMRAGARWEGAKWNLVFPTRWGTPIGSGSLREQFQTAVKAAGLPALTFHDTRHIAASFALATGATMQEVQYMLGHHSIAMTMGTYAHLLPDAQRLASTRAGELLWGVS